MSRTLPKTAPHFLHFHICTSVAARTSDMPKLAVPLPSLTTAQLDHHFNSRDDTAKFLYGGTVALDQLPEVLPRKFYIVNLNRIEDPGSHWVLLYNCSASHCIYYDSFGAPPPQEVKYHMDVAANMGRPSAVNDVQCQKMTSQACGWFCVAVARMLVKGYTFPNVVLERLGGETTPAKSETKLRAWLKKSELI